MLRIKIINPDLNDGISAKMQYHAAHYAAPGTEIICRSPQRGVHSVDNAFTHGIAAVSVCEELLRSEQEEGGYDAYVIACFWNPGLRACREITTKPVVGIGDAALLLSRQLGERPALLCVGGGSYLYRDGIAHLGMQDCMAAVKAVDIASEESFSHPEHTLEKLVRAAREAVEQDGADVILLGCGVMTDFAGALSIEHTLGVPVVDPLAAGVKTAEMLAFLGLSHSRRGYAFPTGAELHGIDGVLNYVR